MWNSSASTWPGLSNPNSVFRALSYWTSKSNVDSAARARSICKFSAKIMYKSKSYSKFWWIYCMRLSWNGDMISWRDSCLHNRKKLTYDWNPISVMLVRDEVRHLSYRNVWSSRKNTGFETSRNGRWKRMWLNIATDRSQHSKCRETLGASSFTYHVGHWSTRELVTIVTQEMVSNMREMMQNLMFNPIRCHYPGKCERWETSLMLNTQVESIHPGVHCNIQLSLKPTMPMKQSPHNRWMRPLDPCEELPSDPYNCILGLDHLLLAFELCINLIVVSDEGESCTPNATLVQRWHSAWWGTVIWSYGKHSLDVLYCPIDVDAVFGECGRQQASGVFRERSQLGFPP